MNSELKGLTSEEYESINKLKEELRRELGESIELILFGSKARGDSTTDSDIDILVLLDKSVDGQLERKIRRVGYDIELEYDNILFQLVIRSKQHWETVKDEFCFGVNVQKEGVQI